MKKTIITLMMAVLGGVTVAQTIELSANIPEVLDEILVKGVESSDVIASYLETHKDVYNVSSLDESEIMDFYDEALKNISFPLETSMPLEYLVNGTAPSQVAAGLCNIFLGWLGVGHFIVGQPGRGVLDILFCWTGIPEIIGFIEGIVWLAMSPERWEAKFGVGNRYQPNNVNINNFNNN